MKAELKWAPVLFADEKFNPQKIGCGVTCGEVLRVFTDGMDRSRKRSLSTMVR
jgi:hypothetical protein